MEAHANQEDLIIHVSVLVQPMVLNVNIIAMQQQIQQYYHRTECEA